MWFGFLWIWPIGSLLFDSLLFSLLSSFFFKLFSYIEQTILQIVKLKLKKNKILWAIDRIPIVACNLWFSEYCGWTVQIYSVWSNFKMKNGAEQMNVRSNMHVDTVNSWNCGSKWIDHQIIGDFMWKSVNKISKRVQFISNSYKEKSIVSFHPFTIVYLLDAFLEKAVVQYYGWYVDSCINKL